MIRDEIQAAQIATMKARDAETLATVRLIQSAIKNRDIEARVGKAV
ncbi:MAG: GatB/YqeY protein, partial [Sphingomonadales bacterium]|nr:GatB/YqeY protein [Sphingomonadales bacterium]